MTYALGKLHLGTGGVDMADFGSIDGRSETPGDGAGRVSASELRPVDAAGREWPAELVALVSAVVDVVEDDLETELAEARREADELRARVAALEAALRVVGSYDHSEDCAGRYDEHGDVADEDEQDDLCDCTTGEATRAISGGTSALDAAVAAAVAAERARVRARVEALAMERCWPAVEGCHGTLMQRDDALRATEGGAP